MFKCLSSKHLFKVVVAPPTAWILILTGFYLTGIFYIAQVFKHTSTDHPDYHNLQEALSKATELCNQVNEGVREKENSDRLEWIQTHVHCDGLTEVGNWILTHVILLYCRCNFCHSVFCLNNTLYSLVATEIEWQHFLQLIWIYRCDFKRKVLSEVWKMIVDQLVYYMWYLMGSIIISCY